LFRLRQRRFETLQDVAVHRMVGEIGGFEVVHLALDLGEVGGELGAALREVRQGARAEFAGDDMRGDQ